VGLESQSRHHDVNKFFTSPLAVFNWNLRNIETSANVDATTTAGLVLSVDILPEGVSWPFLCGGFVGLSSLVAGIWNTTVDGRNPAPVDR